MRRSGSTLIGLSTALCLVLAIFGTASAEIPAKINYQLRLADVATGQPLAGSHNLTFRIFDVSSGGTELWNETQTLEADSAGVISAILGKLSTIEIAFDGPTWLEVEVDEEVLSPRREIVSVPYAFRALRADSLAGFSAEDFVVAGEAGSITVEMIVGGTGSGLDADMVDGVDADAFSDTGHVHDDRYFTEAELSSAGTVNDTLNPVDWTRLKNVPEGFADGTDDGGSVGDSHSLDAADGEPEDAVYVDSDGDVGIGTAEPEERLEVAGTIHSTAGGFKFPDGTVQSTAVSGVEAGGGWVDDSTAVRLEDPADSVGIGTGTPAAKLDVAGTVRMEGFALPSDTSYSYVLTSDSSGTGTWQPPAFGDDHSLDAVDGDPVDVVYVDEYGYVGIGMDPEVALDIHAPNPSYCYLRLTHEATGTNLYDGTRFYIGPGGHARIMNYETADLDFGTDNQTRMTIDSDGNVGIGAYDPINLLHVHRSNAGGSNARFTNSTTGSTYDDGFLVGIDEDGDAKLLSLENRHLSLGTDGAERMRILGDGRVGIGTYNPNDLLHLHASATDEPCFQHWTNNATGTVFDDGFLVGIDAGGDAYIHNYENADVNFATTNNIRMVIKSVGKVGIGTLTPNNQLHVHDPAAGNSCYMQVTDQSIGSGVNDGLLVGVDYLGHAYLLNQENAPLRLGTNDYIRISIQGDGDVGIGTVTPNGRFHVHDTSGQPCFQYWTNVATGTGVDDGFRVGLDATGHAYMHNYENTALRFGTNNHTRMIIEGGGDVGIGDDNPKVKLAVNGLARIQNLTAWPTEGEGMELAYNADLDRGYIQVYDRDGGSWGSLSLGSGNVGIGTSNPAVKLEVKGEDPFAALNTTVNTTGLRLQKNGATEWEMAWNEGSGYLYFYNSGTRMVIEDATGDVGIGTASPAYKLQVGSAGDGTEAAANNWALLSSREYKEDIRSLDRSEYQAVLDELLNTDVVRYRLKRDESGTEHLGVIAEEVPQTMRSSNGKAVSLGDYSAHLLAAIKAQQARIEALEAQVELLRAQAAKR